jgi:hypothetical protein
MDHKWKQLILVVNFLFGLRVNEIPNKTFILFSFHLQCRHGGSGSKTLLVFNLPAHGLEADQLRYREYCGQARRRLTHH